jgi:hypothetical protein
MFRRMMQVQEYKQVWSGSNLTEGYPMEFGQFLDSARGLAFLDQPNYSRFRVLFHSLYETRGFGDDATLDWSGVETPAFSGEITRWISPTAC